MAAVPAVTASDTTLFPAEEIALIAGGSGITPMWQIMQQISADKSDKTKVTLIYSNKSQADILLREEFDALSKKDERFKIVYGLDKKDKGLPADTFEGYVTPEVLSKYLPVSARVPHTAALGRASVAC